MGTGAGFEVGLVDDDHIEALGKLMMHHLSLIYEGLDLFIDTGFYLVLVRKLVIVDLVAILLGRTFASKGTLISEIQSCITAQFGDQV